MLRQELQSSSRLQVGEGGSREAMSYRIGIIGVGAIGGVVGGMLTRAGHDVTLIDQWPDHVEAMKKLAS
jgi:phosphoglycerate dehydrogenase-like enzyme